jgi:hypothetical protein
MVRHRPLESDVDLVLVTSVSRRRQIPSPVLGSIYPVGAHTHILLAGSIVLRFVAYPDRFRVSSKFQGGGASTPAFFSPILSPFLYETGPRLDSGFSHVVSLVPV